MVGLGREEGEKGRESRLEAGRHNLSDAPLSAKLHPASACNQ